MPEGIRGRPFEMSPFHCREMLYDYMTGRLDEQRKSAVEKALKQDKTLKAELDAYIDAAHYCEKLSQVKLSAQTVHDLENIRLQTEIVAEKVRYRNWPDLLKWSSEAVVISVFVAGLAMVIPWGSLQGIFKNPPHNEVILADVEKVPAEATTTVAPPPAKPVGASVKPLPPAEPKVAPKAAATPSPVLAPVTASPVPAVAAPTVPLPIAQVPVAPLAATPAEAPKPRLAEKTKEVAGTKPAAQGMLYRILMNKADIEKLAPELRDKIVALGGKKAGEVEIGWRQPGQNYFHFSLPEANYDKLLSILSELGPSRIYKSPHTRVMPEGIMRIILTIKDGGQEAPKKVEESFGEGPPPSEPEAPPSNEEATPENEQ